MLGNCRAEEVATASVTEATAAALGSSAERSPYSSFHVPTFTDPVQGSQFPGWAISAMAGCTLNANDLL